MEDRDFRKMLEYRWFRNHFVCVGLDTDYNQIPEAARREDVMQTISHFNSAIVDATCDLVCAYKPNIAFYEALGIQGTAALRETILYIREKAPEVPIILDMKRADIGNTNNGYVQAAFYYFDADAVTVHPYLGREALQPFLEQKNKGIFVLCRTSNPGAREFQDLLIETHIETDEGRIVLSRVPQIFQEQSSMNPPLWAYVAASVVQNWNENGNCGLVVGATYPKELVIVRRIVGDLPILIPGIGAQGGDIEATVKAGMDSRKQGMIINSSRGIIFASSGPDFAEAARRETIKLSDMINQYRGGGDESGITSQS